jgi:hypothetical protein
MLNPARDLEYPIALGALNMSTVNVVPKKDVPAEHALDNDDVIDPPEGIESTDPRDRSEDTFDEPDDTGVEVI